MSNFSAKVIADLDTSKIPSQLRDITKKHPLVLNNFTLNAQGLPSQIQAVLDKHKFTINIGNISPKGSLGNLGGSSQEIKGINQEMKEFIALQKRISGAKLQLGKLELAGGGDNQIKVLKSQIEELENAYASAMQTFMKKLTTSASDIDFRDVVGFDDDIIEVVKRATDQLDLFDAKIADTKAKMASTVSTKLSGGSMDASISQLTAKYEKLASTGHPKLEVIKNDLTQLRELTQRMGSASGTEELLSAYSEYNQVLLRVKNNLITVTAESSKMASVMQVDQLNNKMEQWLNRNTAASKKFGDSIRSLQTKMQTLHSKGELTEVQLKEINQEFNNITVSAELAGQTGKKLGTTLTNSFKSILRYVSVSTIIYSIINAFKQMYQNVYNVNTKMTELKKVTNETADTYDKFLDNAGKKAQKLGTTVSDLVSSTADFARLGYDLSDSEELAEIANIYNVVGDEIESIDTATQSIISTMAAFKISVSDAMSIVDKFNAVGNNFAISSGGIGDALQRSASSLAAANNTLDQSIALITAANTVVQDADAVGTAFKTISMRIRGAKTELEDAGLETDGMAESTAKLREEIIALSGVDIMIDENTFKSTYDILDELANKWEKLTDIQRASITTLLAGQRQGNVFGSVMTNFDVARAALSTSEGSEGSATAEHEKWMESLEAKTQQFKAAWEELSQTILDDDFLGDLIDTGTGFLNVLTFIIDKVGMFESVIAGIGIAAFIKNFD